MPFCFVGKVEEIFVGRQSHRSPEIEEPSANPVEGSLEEILFSGILRIEEFQEVQNEELIDIQLGNVRVEIRAFDESQEELVVRSDEL